jgi:hypothetical protein
MMRGQVDLGVCAGRYVEADPRRVAIILPGAGYLPSFPLLWFAREVALQHGWSVLEVWDEFRGGDDPVAWVRLRFDAALTHARSADDVLLVAKSLSTHAVTFPEASDLPGVWLTPILVEPAIAWALAEDGGPALLVGGTRDDLWDPDAAARSRAEVLEIEGGDHALQRDGDVFGSLEALGRVTGAVDAFLGSLGATES